MSVGGLDIEVQVPEFSRGKKTTARKKKTNPLKSYVKDKIVPLSEVTAHIDPSKCVNCGTCREICPATPSKKTRESSATSVRLAPKNRACLLSVLTQSLPNVPVRLRARSTYHLRAISSGKSRPVQRSLPAYLEQESSSIGMRQRMSPSL